RSRTCRPVYCARGPPSAPRASIRGTRALPRRWCELRPSKFRRDSDAYTLHQSRVIRRFKVARLGSAVLKLELHRLFAVTILGAACANGANRPPNSGTPALTSARESVVTIRGFEHGPAGRRAANQSMALGVGRDPAIPNEQVLFVDYPRASSDPAGRDVRCDAEQRNWAAGRAIAFRVKPSRATRLSVSFVDRNNVAY